MEIIKEKLISSFKYVKAFFKWIIIAVFTGVIGGLVGTAFHKSVDYVTNIRISNGWLVFLLPFGGLLTVFLYNLTKVNEGTDRVIESVRTDKKVPALMAPLIFISTVITHLFGGSAGREGAALQLGGSIAYKMGKIFKLNEKDMHFVVMLGMSSVFSALFGVPVTAAFFALEVISVGIIYYAALVPCIISSLIAYKIALLFNITPISFKNISFQPVSAISVLRVIVLALLCALVSIIFCTALKKFTYYFNKFVPNDYLKALIGGLVIIGLTLLLHTTEYNGAGMDVISSAMSGTAKPEAFALKILFTVITIGAGFKGGEIVPAFFAGATFGCVAGGLLGLDPSFGAAIGFVSLFCGVVNCPVASMILALEVFGSDSIILFAVACGVSYMMSGYYGLYSSQKIMYSKTEAKFININAK
ncbi:MAG: chloride channel protein [Clostridia bacterium]|nr:chloride channel protein [Clostridia bacterium]